ncbi:MAG TPA: hypothetical protein VEM13_11840 [Gemmatimonadales bacterium]|nr:hypothetical protein [Gemmatimonadales bacterium]
MRRLCFTLSASVAGLVIVASPSARAQQLDTLSAAQRAGWALARLGVGQRVRVHGSGVGRVEGWVVSSSSALVTLHTDGSSIEVPAPGVDSLWVRGGTHAGTGALIGGVVGGLSLGAFGAMICPGECDISSGAALVRGGVVGAVIGSAFGALIGVAFPKWQLRVP